MYCPKCGARCTGAYCPMCGEFLNKSNYQTSPAYLTVIYQEKPKKSQSAQTYQLPMNWYNFLIYFSLFANAVLNALSGIVIIFGARYGDSTKIVYSDYPELLLVDIFLGVASLSIAAFSIYTRFRLANYCENGPTCLTKLYAFSATANVLYSVLISKILPSDSGTLISLIGSIIGTTIGLIINQIYFDKRKDLFVN